MIIASIQVNYKHNVGGVVAAENQHYAPVGRDL
jgi:hypothetical protein